MQGLGSTKNCGHALQGGADNVVIRILLRKAPSRGLAMGSQHERLNIFGVEWLDQLMPQKPCSPQHGDIHEKIHADSKEK